MRPPRYLDPRLPLRLRFLGLFVGMQLWSCGDGMGIYLFFLFIPMAIFCRQFVTKAGTGIQILQTSASGSTIFVATPSIP